MARKKKAPVRRKKRIPWTPAHLKVLKAEAGKKNLKQLARLLGRTPAAVQLKASNEQISLRMRKR